MSFDTILFLSDYSLTLCIQKTSQTESELKLYVEKISDLNCFFALDTLGYPAVRKIYDVSKVYLKDSDGFQGDLILSGDPQTIKNKYDFIIETSQSMKLNQSVATIILLDRISINTKD